MRDSAETVGLVCLSWLIGNDDLLPVFMNATGASEADLRAGAGDPGFLASVLDFLLMDDAWILACCAAQGLPNDAPMRARAALPGGVDMHWT
jgi:hypothetical protein